MRIAIVSIEELFARHAQAIYAEGKVYPMAIGVLKMSMEDIISKNKGIGIESVHYLDDGLWRLKDPVE